MSILIIFVLICISLYLNLGGVMTKLKVILGVIRTNTNFRDLSGEYHLTENVSTLLKKNFAVPLMFVVDGNNTGSLNIQAEWYVDGKKNNIDYGFSEGQVALNFINHNETGALQIKRSFNYCNPGKLQCMKFISRITLDNNQIKIHVGGPVGIIVYAKK
jgi:hypothetical protein